MHPGSVASELQRHSDPAVLEEARKKHGTNFIRKTLDQGASTTLVAALDPTLNGTEGEVYMADCGFYEPAEWCRGDGGIVGAEKLWEASERFVGEDFSYVL